MSLLRFAIFFFATVILAGWSPARAASGPAPCTLQSTLWDRFDTVSAPGGRRDCDADRWSLAGQRSWLFFDQSAIAAAGKGPLEFNARTSRFQRISLYVRYADGTTASIVREGSEAMPYRVAGPDFYLTLPQRASPPVEVAVAFDRLG